jgi:hypothetical protein
VLILAGADWDTLLDHVLLGAAAIVVLAVLINNAEPDRSYPTFWY